MARSTPPLGVERRWVLYKGYAEASTIPPGWYGWMHHRVDTPPTSRITSRASGRSRIAELHRLAAGLSSEGLQCRRPRPPKVTGDYKAWSPGE